MADTQKTKTAMPDAAMEELKPCPFCGGAISIGEASAFGVTLNGFECGGCDQSSGFCSVFEPEHRRTAIAAWNRRASVAAGARTETPEVEALVKAGNKLLSFKEYLLNDDNKNPAPDAVYKALANFISALAAFKGA